MAMDTSDIKGRDARDRIINTLGLGLTYPLRDLPVQHRTLVSVDLPAEMRILEAQTGVWYQLCDEDGNPMTLADLAVGMVVEIQGKDAAGGGRTATRINVKGPDAVASAAEADGEVTLTGAIEARADDRITVGGETFAVTRETLVGATCMDVEDPILWSPPITEDVTYTILAFRKDPDRRLNLETYLNQIISLQAGVDPSLAVSFMPYDHQRVDEDVPDQIFVNYWDSDEAKEKVRIKISESQEGVTYQLFETTEESCTALTKEDGLSLAWKGNKGDLVFTTKAGFNKDIRLLVKAYRTTRAEICAYLETTLTVNVRPDPAVAVSIDALIYDYHTKARLTLANTQASATYALYQRDLVEADYVLQGTAGALEIPTGEGHSVFVKAPEKITDWNAASGFAQVGPFVEEGGAVSITTGELAEDTLFVVRATKIENGESLPLDQVVAVLVRPNPAPEVGVQASPIDADSIGVITVNGAQKGVFYQLRLDADDTPVGAPGYHVEDRFLERTRVEVDFAVESQGTPLLALLSGPLTETTTFNILATKIFSGLPAQLVGVATVEVESGIDPSLAVAFEPYEHQNADGPQIVTNYGNKVRVKIFASQEGISYKLFEDTEQEVSLSNAWKGKAGEIILFPNAGFNEDIGIKIKAFRTSNPALFAYLDARLTVNVRPNPAVAVTLEAAVLDYNAKAKLSLAGFQASATYTLYKREITSSEYVDEGTAGALEIATGEGHSVFVKAPEQITNWDDPSGFVPVKDFTTALGKLTTGGLPEDALFVVRATKIENGESLPLDQVVAVLVRPNTALGVSVEPAAEADDGSVVTLATTQRGVFYELLDAADTPVGSPGYHYEDRWLERTRVELDFAVESQGDAVLLLPTGPLTEPTTFTLRATKITTALTATVEVQAGEG